MQHVLYRQKEQFSDGVGYSWIDGLKENAERHVLIHPSSLVPSANESALSSPNLHDHILIHHRLALRKEMNLKSGYPTCVVISQVSDQMLKHAKHVYPFNTPLTKEAYYYRMIFEKHFPQVSPNPNPNLRFSPN